MMSKVTESVNINGSANEKLMTPVRNFESELEENSPL